MLITVLFDALALAAVLGAIYGLRGLGLPATMKARLVMLCAIVAAACILGSIMTNFGNAVQQETGIDLHLPSTAQTKAVIWMKEHRPQPPDPKDVGRNIKIVTDGQIFFRAYQGQFAPDGKLLMEDAMKLPPRPDHLLSFGEEQQYYSAAEKVFKAIAGLAGPEPTPTPAAK